MSKAGSIAQAGALISAILASACCWLPLLLIAFGVSGGALAAKFEAARPVLLPVTFVLLGLAFHFTYRKPKAVTAATSGGEESCGCPPERSKSFTVKKLNKIMLWVVTAFVLAFSFFPNYVGYLFGGSDSAHPRSDSGLVEWSMTVEGMTCQGCAAHIQSELLKIPGVLEAKVDYEQARAVIVATSEVAETDLRKVVDAAGYSISSAEKMKTKQGGI
jgi:copper chaperone CopZ